MKLSESVEMLCALARLEKQEASRLVDKIKELERLARIGEATEKAFKEKYLLMKMGSESKIKGNIEKLLEWAESEDK